MNMGKELKSKLSTFDFYTLFTFIFASILCVAAGLESDNEKSSGNNLDNFSEKYFQLLMQAKCKAKCHTQYDTLPRKANNKILFVRADCATDSCRNCTQDFKCLEDPNHLQECEDKLNERLEECEELILWNQKPKSMKNDNVSFFTGFPSPSPIFWCSLQEKEKHISVSFYIDYTTQESPQKIADYNIDYVPRFFIVETETDGVWNGGDVFMTQFWTFNIQTTVQKMYRVRITPVSPKAVYKPTLSIPFQSYEMKDRIAKAPINPHIIKYVFDSWSKNPNAIFGFESGSGLNATCKSLIHLLSDEDMSVYERSKIGDALWVEFKNLKYEKLYDVRIIETYAPHVEFVTNFQFVVPRCKDLSQFRDLCNPDKPSNLAVSNISHRSFLLNWIQENENYGNLSHRVAVYYRQEFVMGFMKSVVILSTDKLFFNRSIGSSESSIEVQFPIDKFYINESLNLYFIASLFVENLHGKSEKAFIGFHHTFFGPKEPTNLAIINISATSFILSWELQINNGNKSLDEELQENYKVMSFNVVATYIEVFSQLTKSHSSPQNSISKIIFLNTSLSINVNSLEVSFPTQVIKIIDTSRIYSFEIGIITKSPKGCSKPSAFSFNHQFKGLLDENKPEKAYNQNMSIWLPLSMIFLMSLVLIFITLFLIFMMKDLQKKRERKKNRRKYFEGLDKESIEFNVLTLDNHNLQWEINLEDLTFGENIGEGAFGIVKKALLQRNGERTMVAVKTLRHGVGDNKDFGHFWEEFDILQNLDSHRNVVALMGVVKGNVPALVVEYCPGGDLQSFLRKAHRKTAKSKSENGSPHTEAEDNTSQNGEDVKARLPMVTNLLYFFDRSEDNDEILVTEHDLLSFARQVSCGMEFLEKNKIVHRDLAARNVLIGVNAVLKIGDFGLSRDIYEQNLYKKNSKGMIPIKWLAIESLLQQIYTTKSDVWSFGILLWEIVTFGGSPYPGIDNGNIFDLLSSGYRMQRPDNCSDEIYALMKECWHEDPKDRPNFQIIHCKLDKLIEKSSFVTYISIMPNRESFYEPDERDETLSETI